MLSKKIKIKSEKNFLSLIHNGSPILKITKDFQSLVDFLSDLLPGELEITVNKTKKKTKKKTVRKELEGKKIIKAVQLESKYRKMKQEFYKNKNVKKIAPHHKEFDNFLKAVDIMQRNKVKIKKFMKAQIKGLSFVEGGKGIFPRTSQISTSAAEQRVLDYLRDENFKVELTDAEARTELMNNKKYKRFQAKIKNGDASLNEALYVEACQLARRNEVQELVRQYIKQLRK